MCRRPPKGAREQHLEGKEAGLAAAGWGEVNEVRLATESSANRTGSSRAGTTSQDGRGLRQAAHHLVLDVNCSQKEGKDLGKAAASARAMPVKELG